MKKFSLNLATRILIIVAFSFTALFYSYEAKSQVKISQVYPGGGGSTGAYLRDYVEIYNSTCNAVDISGWSLAYGSSTGNYGSSASNVFTFPAGTVIQPKKYILLECGGIGTAGTALPVTADFQTVTTGFSMSGTAGKVGLFNTAISNVACTSVVAGTLVDKLSWGTANCPEGTAKTAPSSSQIMARNDNGQIDTDNNNSDFTNIATSSAPPRNSSSPSNPLSVCGPELTTTIATSITTSSAVSGGNVTSDAGSAVTAKGVVWDININPNISLSTKTDQGGGTGVFTSTLNGLSSSTRYYYRAYATNAIGTTYGLEYNFWTKPFAPLAPVVTNPSFTSLDVQIASGDGNAAGILYAIQDSVSGKYVGDVGTLVTNPLYLTSSQWATTTVTDLFSGTTYYFRAIAKNAGDSTAVGLTTPGTTQAALNPTISVTPASLDFENVCINSQSAAKSFEFSGTSLDGTDVIISGVSFGGAVGDVLAFSTSAAGPYTSTLTFSGYGTAIPSTTVYAKYTAELSGVDPGAIAISGGGAFAAVNTTITGINTAPAVGSPASSSITGYTASLGGNVTSIGCSNVTERGIYWSTDSSFADGAGTKVSETGSFGTGAYSVNVSGLAPGTIVYYKAFATNNGGTTYSIRASFTAGAPNAPVATAATDITDNSFTANWDASSGADSYRLDVAASPVFIGPGFATDLFISEYVEGSSNNKYIEIYNGTGASVNLADYQLRSYANGGTSPTSTTLSGSLLHGQTIVYRNSGAVVYTGASTILSSINFNGNDAVALFKISTASNVDIVGRIGEDPGSAWTAAGGTLSTADKSLVRKPSVTSGVTVNPASGFPTLATEWDVYLIDDVSNLGSHNMTITPSNLLPGYENLTVSGLSQSVTGLTGGTTYYYRVRAVAGSTTSANSNTISATTKQSQTITFDPLSAKAFGDAPFDLTATASSGLPVSYISSNPLVATISGNTVTILAAGSTNITASQAGDAQYGSAASVTRTLTVNKAGQTISFDPLSNKLDNDPPFSLSASASSGLSVSFTSSNPAVATVSGNTVTILAQGTTIITASQSGNDNYEAAADVPRTLVVLSSTGIPQTITFSALSSATYGDAPFQLTASASSGLPVSYVSSNTAVATVAGDLVTIVGPGTTTITASQDGNSTFNPATPVSQSLSVSPKTLTISGVSAVNRAFDSTLIIAISRGVSVVNGIVGSDDVSVIGNTGFVADINAGVGKPVSTAWTLSGADAYKYTFTQPDYMTVNIFQVSQTISFPAIPVKTFTSPKFRLAATATSNLPITYVSSDPLVATILGDSVTITGVGTAVITASQAGDINYTAAASVDSPLVVNKATQFITFSTIITSKTTVDAPFTASVSASSGLPVTITSSNPAVATVTDSTVTIVGIGSTTLTATVDSGTTFRAAAPVTRTLNVTGPILAGWDLTGANLNATFAATSANTAVDTASGRSLLSRGPGAVASSAGNSFRTTGFQNNGIATTNTDYFQFVVKPATGKIVSVNSLVANLAGTAGYAVAPGVSNQFAFSLNGTNFTLIDAPVVTVGTPASFVLNLSSVSALQNLGSSATVTFRYYASGQTTTGGWGFNSPNAGIFGVALGGTVTDVLLPVITSSATATGTVATAFSYNITASNFPSSYSATGLPAGLSLNSATGAITGTPTVAGVFNVTIGATNDAGSASQNLEVTIGKGDQTITFGSLAPKTFGDADFNLAATATSGLAVSYSSSNTSVATVSGNTVTIVGAGSTTITASQAGDDNYNAAVSVDQVLVVNKANQTITFGLLADKFDTDGSFALTAISSSGLPVSYSSSNTLVITISGSTATIAGPGVTTITASQAGNDNYNAAASVDQNQTVISTALLDQTITFGTLADKTYGDAAFQLTASASSGLAVSYISSNTSVATVSGDIVTIVGPGSTNITALQSGNGTYNPAPSVTQSLTVNKKTLTVSGAVAQDKVYDGNTNAIITGATLIGIVGLDVVSVSGGGSFADVNAGTGISVTAALVLGGADAGKYELQQPVGLSANITQASQTITFNAPAPRTTASAPFTLNGTSSSGLAVSYTSSNPLVATVSGNTVTVIGVGITDITASQSGNGNYLAATDVVQTLVVTLAPNIVTWTFSNTGVADSLPVGGANVVNGLSISKMVRGNNNGSATATFLSTTSTSNYAGASGSHNAGGTSRNGGFDKDTSTYFSFTLTPDLNKRVKLDTISFGSRSTSSGVRGLIVRSSLDNYASNVALDSALNNSAWTFKKPVTSAVTSGYSTPVTFRIYGFGGTGASFNGAANWRIDDVTLALFVETCPNPANPGTISGTNTVCAGGGTTSLSSNGDAGGTWSSSNTAVATVDVSTGVVTGVSAGTATITYSVTGSCGTNSANYVVTVNNCNSIVNVKAFIQGYYDDATGTMRPALLNSSVAGATSTQADTLTVEIHDGVTGAIIGSPVKTILNTNGTSQAVFPALSGSHYIVVKHRNAIETWSASPVAMGTVVNYDFSTSASQAYSSNQVSVAAGVFALWSGDLNQDGAIESADYAAIENDVLSVSFGYNPSDITGDGVTESADYALIENNLLQVIFVQKPF